MVSTIAGYLLGFNESQPFNGLVLYFANRWWLLHGGASNVFNQIIEIRLDAKMDQLKTVHYHRCISKQNAFILGCVLTILGLIILYNVNPKTAMFRLFRFSCM